MKPTPLYPRKFIPCARCGRRMLCAPYSGTYPAVVRCADCRRDHSTYVPVPADWRRAA